MIDWLLMMAIVSTPALRDRQENILLKVAELQDRPVSAFNRLSIMLMPS